MGKLDWFLLKKKKNQKLQLLHHVQGSPRGRGDDVGTPVCSAQCGTVVPVWLNGTHPSVADGMVSRQACANFETGSSVVHKCCEHSLQIGVKNCKDYYVYYLKATPSCPISYCAGKCRRRWWCRRWR